MSTLVKGEIKNFVPLFKGLVNEEVELPVFWGKVVVKEKAIETWFIPGDSLLGMEFLSLAGSNLTLNFKKEEVMLIE